MNSKLTIKSKKEIKPQDPNGGSYYEIILSDNSEWICDYRGENWKRKPHKTANKLKTLPPDDVFLSNFKKELKDFK